MTLPILFHYHTFKYVYIRTIKMPIADQIVFDKSQRVVIAPKRRNKIRKKNKLN